MTQVEDGTILINHKNNEFLFLANDMENDLYIIEKGKVMVFVQKGSEIIPVAYLGVGEYIGELSFFDEGKRSASIVCLEDSLFLKIPSEEMKKHCPGWVRHLGQQLTKKIRSGDELIRSKGIRKKNVEGIKPLSMEEQSHYFKLVESVKQSRKST
ncbi:MAG: cyclic nucleotide-binding domain-containing protein [Bacteriovoracaceae bacterium]|nr:cyclic nucleotide-binding domain-containing protein [Bacteriovoracaceae bacterium]